MGHRRPLALREATWSTAYGTTYWDVHGPATVGLSHVDSVGMPAMVRSHIFVSKPLFRVKDCDYLHDLRGPGLSSTHSCVGSTDVNLHPRLTNR